MSDRSRHAGRRPVSPLRRRLWVESLEDRITPATTVSDGGGTTLTIAVDPGQTLLVSSQGNSYRFATNAAGFTIDNGGVANANDFTGLGTSAVTLTSAGLARYSKVAIVDSGDGVFVRFLDSGANTYNDSFDVNLDAANPGEITFAGRSSFGSASLTARSVRKIALTDATVTSTSGNLTLAANTQMAASPGDFIGMTLVNSTVQSTGSGSVTLTARGGNADSGFQAGVLLNGGSKVLGGTTGLVSIDGTGGTGVTGGSGNNHGVFVSDANTLVSSAGANVKVVGRSQASGASSRLNVGVFVVGGAGVTAGGGGTVTITGTGGNGGDRSNHGVAVEQAGSFVRSGGGAVTVVGRAGGAASSQANFGVSVQLGAVVSAGGTGKTSVDGTGGNTGGAVGDNIGVFVSGQGMGTATISSAGGNVTVTGKGNGTTVDSFGNIGVYVFSGGRITAGGQGVVRVTGRGGDSPGKENVGVRVDSELGKDTRIGSSGGNVFITGTGGNGQERFNAGVHLVFNQARIQPGGAGNLTITGTGGTGVGDNQGVIAEKGAIITTSGGNTAVTGTAGSGSGLDFQFGVRLQENATISAGGTGTVTVTGTGGSTTGGNAPTNGGVLVDASRITSTGGAVAVSGTAGGSAGGSVGNYFGVLLTNAGQITSGGASPVAVTGTAGGTGGLESNIGVFLNSGAKIASGGTGDTTVVGTGGSTTGNFNDGIRVVGAGSTITSVGGAVRLTGNAGGTGGSATNFGVSVNSGGVVTAGGTGAVSVFGTASPATGANPIAVLVADSGSKITSSGGNVLVAGGPGATGDPTTGVTQVNGGLILAGAPGTTTIDPTGGTPVPPTNTRPTITDVPDQSATSSKTFGPLAFTIADAETPVGSLNVTVTSSNTTFVPAANVVLGGSNANRTVTVTPVAGQTGTSTITLTVTDAVGLTVTDTFNVSVGSSPPPPAGRPELVGVPLFAAAAGGTVNFYNPDKSLRTSVTPFPGFTGNVRVATADFNGDGVADLVVGTGPGAASQVVVLSGVDGTTQLFTVNPFEAAFVGGVYVTAGDVDGDGKADLIITPDEGGGPRVDVYAGNGFTKMASFFSFPDDTNFRGGARAATGDINGDGRTDVVVAAGFGGGPRVTAFSGFDVAQNNQNPTPLVNFFAFETALRNGVFITAGDLNGDGKADLIAGGGPGGGPRVVAFSADNLPVVPNEEGRFLANFLAGDPNNRGGIRVAVKNLDGDARADLVVGGGTGASGRVIAYAGTAVQPAGTPTELFNFEAFAGQTDGVFVG